MKQLYEITLRGDGKIIKGTVLTTLRNKFEAVIIVLDRNGVHHKDRHKYRIKDIKLLVPNSWLELEDKGIEVN